ncbi:hypothetical protein Dimus_009714 [Dionaea muscipula]
MSAAQPEPEVDKKPVLDRKPHINLKVKNQDGNEVWFRIRRTTPLRELMNGYCTRQNDNVADLRFFIDGRRLGGDETPDQLELEDGYEIDVFGFQIGGSSI